MTGLAMPAEFIAIARISRPPESVPDVNDARNTFDTNVFRKLQVDGHVNLLVDVMWIRWGADGLARRMVVGQVHVDAWESLKPAIKNIHLA
jgi:hypothetical protein